MNSIKLIAFGALACVLLAAVSPADAQCASNGIQLNSACGQFTSAIKANAATILSSTCDDLNTKLQDPQYGTPSAACCNYARSFFGGNCACDASTQNQARLFYGYSTDQLNAAATAAAIRCGASGCGAKCPAVST
nr:putative extracellular protein CSOL_089a [Pseudococcomyxa simplex]